MVCRRDSMAVFLEEVAKNKEILDAFLQYDTQLLPRFDSLQPGPAWIVCPVFIFLWHKPFICMKNHKYNRYNFHSLHIIQSIIPIFEIDSRKIIPHN